MVVKHRVLLCRDPIPDIPADEKEGKKKQHYPRQQSRQIFHLAPDNHAPTRICGVMHNDPEIAANQNSEKVEKGKEPGKRELFAQLAAGGRDESDEEGDQQAENPDSQEGEQQSVDVAALKNFGSWNG